MKFFENKKIIYRFEAGGENGFGHLNRSVEFIKFLKKKKFDIIICTSKKSKKYININDVRYIYKSKKLDEIDFWKKINKTFKNFIIIIDHKYVYSENIIKDLNKKNSVIFIQNFSQGAGFSDKMVIPDNHSYKKKINLNFQRSKIYYGSKYLILRDKILNLKKTKSEKYLSINFGGSDPNNIGEIVLGLLIRSNWKYKTYFMLGDAQSYTRWISKYNVPKNIIFCKYEFKKLINSELTISAFGVTTYELLYHGVKNLIILNEDKKNFKLNNKFKNVKNLGFYKKINYNNFFKSINFYWKKKCVFSNKKLTLDNKAKKRLFNLLKY